MKKLFWAKVAFKNIYENKKFHLANLVVDIFTVITLYLYFFVATNEGLKTVKGYETLKVILYFGAAFLTVVTYLFKTYTGRILLKRRKKELGLYEVWGLGTKEIACIMGFENIYMYLLSVTAGLLLGMLSQRAIYETLFKMMKCSSNYEGGFNSFNLLITMLIVLVINLILYIKNLAVIKGQNAIALLTKGNTNQVIRKIKILDVIKGFAGVALIAGAYAYVNNNEDFINSISTILVAIGILFIGSYLVISSFVVMVEFALKSKKSIYYKNPFFITIAKLIAKTKNNAMSLAVINILFTCVVLGTSSTAALYLGTEKQAAAAFNVDGEINTTVRENKELVADIVKEAAKEAGTEVELIRTFDRYAFQTVFDEEKGSFDNNNVVTKDLPELVEIITLDDYNKYENKNLTLEDDEVFFIGEEDFETRDYDELDYYGKKLKVKEVLEGPLFARTDNIKYAYEYTIIVKDYETMEEFREYMVSLGNDREIHHWINYTTSGNLDEKTRFDEILGEKLINTPTVEYFDSNATQRRTRYARNAIFLFIGIFISIIFVMYMIFIMYYKQIQEAVDDVEDVRIMKKVGMVEKEIKQGIQIENRILFFIPIVMAFCHVVACFGLICSVLKLFMLTDMKFAALCIFAFSMFILLVYLLMYAGANKVYTNIVLNEHN
ncbi:MAG: hypothetical protein K5792_04585 [Butyrivibrio sp.]|nr:hypothetical protein [Butyrivibrio sp.]